MKRREQPAVPVGRRGECALIGAFLDRPAAGGAALLLRGEPGAGKTVLLDAAADAASAAKVWVLRAAGAELEADLTFPGLNQLLFPVYEEELHELSVMHRDALTVAVGGRNARRRVRRPANAVTHDLRRLGLWPVEPTAINETISDWEVHNERARTGHR